MNIIIHIAVYTGFQFVLFCLMILAVVSSLKFLNVYSTVGALVSEVTAV